MVVAGCGNEKIQPNLDIHFGVVSNTKYACKGGLECYFFRVRAISLSTEGGSQGFGDKQTCLLQDSFLGGLQFP
jgi:hypothetical protein